ncbi:MAG: GNAT family N-acetyltransferase [Actinobacteria bacterium]|nr:GNAT family N-acetyltransferase [Actinomycetota bacterium]MBW3642025.1 GNAT family N-acetyltransferase [Actinomycetota bacterium]
MVTRATVVRPVEHHEHATLGELTVTVYREALASELVDYAPVLRDVAGRLAAGCEVLVAEDGGRLIGGVTYVPGPGPYAQLAGHHEAELRMLVVDPGAQGKGTGAELVRACIDRAVTAGRHGLALGTMPEMAAARRLYERLGFVRVPARDGFVPGDRPLLCYWLDLGATDAADCSSEPSAAGGVEGTAR